MAADTDDEYEAYPCLVDGAPASIYLNRRYEHETRSETDLYTLAVWMSERGEHGIGTADEGEVLNALEEALIARVAALGLVYAGRLRTGGIWETTFYGPPGHLDALNQCATDLAIGRRWEARSRPDARWSYYRELLVPDAERRQWTDDRRLVDVLREQGDALVTPRRVDHWLYFRDTASRDAFVTSVAAQGFTTEADGAERTDDVSVGVQVSRTDCVELEHIHEVVMALVDAAQRHGGRYDHWVASIEG